MALGDGALREMLHASGDLDDALAALALLIAGGGHTYADPVRVLEDRFADLSCDGHAICLRPRAGQEAYPTHFASNSVFTAPATSAAVPERSSSSLHRQ